MPYHERCDPSPGFTAVSRDMSDELLVAAFDRTFDASIIKVPEKSKWNFGVAQMLKAILEPTDLLVAPAPA